MCYWSTIWEWDWVIAIHPQVLHPINRVNKEGAGGWINRKKKNILLCLIELSQNLCFLGRTSSSVVVLWHVLFIEISWKFPAVHSWTLHIHPFIHSFHPWVRVITDTSAETRPGEEEPTCVFHRHSVLLLLPPLLLPPKCGQPVPWTVLLRTC